MSAASDKSQAKATASLPASFAGALGRIAEDLFTIEVTTIVQENIPATKMPPPMEALHDIARMYEEKLTAMHAGPAAKPGNGGGGMPAFDSMMQRAGAMAPAMARSEDAAILARIRDNSAALMKLSRKMEEPSNGSAEMQLNPEELMRLHMIWHMGVEQIAMKTVIHLTGDVVTRIRPEYVGEDGRALVELHHAAVRTAIECWTGLVDVLGSLVGSVGQLLFSGKNRGA